MTKKDGSAYGGGYRPGRQQSAPRTPPTGPGITPVTSRSGEDGPYTVPRGHSERNGYVLTHAEWHPCHFDIDIAQYESGVRDPAGEFSLIQHGMSDFALVERIVWRAIDKGWDADRITDVLQYLRSRRPWVRTL